MSNLIDSEKPQKIYGQWSGVVTFSPAPNQQEEAYGIAIFSIEKRNTDEFTLVFIRSSKMEAYQYSRFPNCRISGNIEYEEPSLVLHPVHVTAEEWPCNLDRRSAGNRIPVDNWEEFRNCYGSQIPEKFHLTFTTGDEILTGLLPTTNRRNQDPPAFELKKASKMPSCRTEPVSQEKLEEWLEHEPSTSSDSLLFRGLGALDYDLESTWAREDRYDLRKYLRPEVLECLEETKNYIRSLCQESQYQSVFRDFAKDEVPEDKMIAKFLRTLRHFGYPSPLMDWSTDPRISLFFAYMAPEPKEDRQLYVLDYERLKKEWPMFQNKNFECNPLSPLLAPFQLVEFDENSAPDREKRQSGRYIFCELKDVGPFLSELATIIQEQNPDARHSYLYRYNLPYKERDFVLSSLKTMGICESSVLPTWANQREGSNKFPDKHFVQQLNSMNYPMPPFFNARQES